MIVIKKTIKKTIKKMQCVVHHSRWLICLGMAHAYSDVVDSQSAINNPQGITSDGSLFTSSSSTTTVSPLLGANESGTVANLNTLSDHSSNLTEVFLSLFFVIALIFILAWVIKRIGYTPMGKNNVMKVNACLPLSSKEKLMLIQVGNEQILIGVAPGFIGNIKTLDTPVNLEPMTTDVQEGEQTREQGADSNPLSNAPINFSQLLNRFVKKGTTVNE